MLRLSGLPPFLTACWWLTHPEAITGVSVAATGNSPVVDCLFRFFECTECRVHDINSLQVHSQTTESCWQPEYSGLLMSCQMVDWVCRGVVVSSGLSPLAALTVLEQGYDFLESGGGQGLQLFAPRLGHDVRAPKMRRKITRL